MLIALRFHGLMHCPHNQNAANPGSFAYPEILRLMGVLVIFPFGNAVAERGFSLQNNVKTKKKVRFCVPGCAYLSRVWCGRQIGYLCLAFVHTAVVVCY